MAANPSNSTTTSALGKVSGAGVWASCTLVLCMAAILCNAAMVSPPARIEVLLVEVPDSSALLCTVATISKLSHCEQVQTAVV